ncbi:uncharacterized protein HaLaN_13375, partial [Haematococcus lacustris]
MQHVSGESAPVPLAPGDLVPAGSVNTDGLLVVKVTAKAEDSTPARIARMAAQAQANRPRLSRVLERVGAVWSKAVVVATLASLLGLVLAGVPLLGPGGALYRAMGVLTAGSPCAVVLVPLAYVCAIATVTRKGVLVKSGAALDALTACDTVALDKTGTVTSGNMSLVAAAVVSSGGQQLGTGAKAGVGQAPAVWAHKLELAPTSQDSKQQPEEEEEEEDRA